MFCMQCGTQLPDTAQFCYSCGSKITPQSPPSQQEQPKKTLDDLLNDEKFLEHMAKGIAKDPALTAQALLTPYEEYAKTSGAVTWDTIDDAKKLLNTALERKDPLVGSYKQVLDVYFAASEVYFLLHQRWLNLDSRGEAAREDFNILRKSKNDLRVLCKNVGFKDFYIDRIMDSAGILTFLDGELFALILAVHMYRGRLAEITAQQLAFFGIFRGYDDDFVQKKMDDASSQSSLIFGEG